MDILTNANLYLPSKPFSFGYQGQYTVIGSSPVY